jgi:hypothetical protein
VFRDLVEEGELCDASAAFVGVFCRAFSSFFFPFLKSSTNCPFSRIPSHSPPPLSAVSRVSSSSAGFRILVLTLVSVRCHLFSLFPRPAFGFQPLTSYAFTCADLVSFPTRSPSLHRPRGVGRLEGGPQERVEEGRSGAPFYSLPPLPPPLKLFAVTQIDEGKIAKL